MFEKFINKLKNDKYITVEITPPKSADINSTINKIDTLDFTKYIDGFSVTDSPLAKLKYSPIIASYKIQQALKKPVIATMNMRDKNKIALQSDLLAGNDLDVRSILALTGDPVSISDQPKPKGVFEGTSSLLLDIINNFNNNIDLAGKPISPSLNTIYSYAVTNSYTNKPEFLTKKIAKKLEKNLVGIISQPVFSKDEAKSLIKIFEDASEISQNHQTQLILGFFPILSLKTAIFLNDKVPHIKVPSFWIQSLSLAKTPKEEFDIGMKLSIDLFNELKELHPKIHIMSVNKFDIVKDILINS
ncbi:MAG: 5,10-methylenetetrahydrofolate reductase (EC [uncultured Campylobacterales bacterium]|uniref:Methylenetetrahydrofolate reductase n=1 Tax=uncultured Campylobacterales bacterium TaxID=352960 RepID=A0A6S6SYX9_9BACT|nr:MAG: 5,10-methylenetetrahydrofolate reductase (EC [uncultured Campylobacterales bacterium]